MTEIEKIKQQKEQIDLIDELSKINKYIYQLSMNYRYSEEIQNFIVEIVNKYRYKVEVKNYYMQQDGVDNIEGSQLDTLLLIKSMIKQYAVVQYGETFFKNKD